MTRTFTYRIGGIEVDVTVPEEDYDWVYALFLRNAKPFKALKDMGFEPKDEKEDTDRSQSS